ncbi:MAG: hypothetical protein LBV19_08235 [Streptococcaceae bacterium]|jgi:hypothetical protein|nr:hypothetical protein [Streptococcaceae bacterium]
MNEEKIFLPLKKLIQNSYGVNPNYKQSTGTYVDPKTGFSRPKNCASAESFYLRRLSSAE